MRMHILAHTEKLQCIQDLQEMTKKVEESSVFMGAKSRLLETDGGTGEAKGSLAHGARGLGTNSGTEQGRPSPGADSKQANPGPLDSGWWVEQEGSVTLDRHWPCKSPLPFLPNAKLDPAALQVPSYS